MTQKIVLVVVMLLGSWSVSAAELPDESSRYPRMPDEYRSKNQASRNPIGMSIYDAAETAAEEDYFGTVVVPLEESRRIIRERKAKEKEAAEQVKE